MFKVSYWLCISVKSFSLTKENRTSDLQAIVVFLKNYCQDHDISFVQGRGKRKTVHQRYYELFHSFLERQSTYDYTHLKGNKQTAYIKPQTYEKWKNQGKT